MNHGVQFSNKKDIYFSVTDWHHTIRLDVPQKVDFNDHDNITLCKKTFYSELGCPLSTGISSYFNHLHEDLKQVHDIIQGIVPYISFDTHKKRGLSYVGDLGTHIFSIATEGQLAVLKKHINAIVGEVNDITNVFSHTQGEMTSFIHDVKEEMKNFDEFVKESAQIRQYILDEIQTRDKIHEINERIILRYTEKIAQIRASLNKLIIGINGLNAGKLSSHIIAADRLNNIIQNISAKLKNVSDDYQLISDDAAYYYKNADFIYGQYNNSIYVTISFPVVRRGNYKIYQVDQFPIPINEEINNTDASMLTSIENYFVINNDDNAYATFDNNFLKGCVTYGQFILCKTEIVMYSANKINCLAELYSYKNLNTINEVCKYKMIPHMLTPSIMYIYWDTVIAYMQKNIQIDCLTEQSKSVKDCKFCILKLPCKCQIRGVQEETLHNFESCVVESQSVDILYPINIPLLSHFFNNSILDEVLTSTDFTNKTIINLPKYQMFEHKSREILDRSKQIEISLDHFATKTKRNEKIYAHLAESIYDGSTPIQSNMSNFGMVTMIGMCKTIINSCFLCMVYRKYRVLVMSLILTKQIQAAKLEYKTPTTESNIDLFFQDVKESLRYEHGIIILLFIIIVLIILIIIRLYAATNKKRNKVVLHITNGLQCICVDIMDIPTCPIEWNFVIPNLVSVDQVKGQLLPELNINLNNAIIQNKITKQILTLPESVKLGYFQARNVRYILNTTYILTIEIVHNDRVMSLPSNDDNKPSTDNPPPQYNDE